MDPSLVYGHDRPQNPTSSRTHSRSISLGRFPSIVNPENCFLFLPSPGSSAEESHSLNAAVAFSGSVSLFVAHSESEQGHQ